MASKIETLLKDYGYVQEGDLFARPLGTRLTERWRKTEGGWFCESPKAFTTSGNIYGELLEDGFIRVPFTTSERFAGVGGLNPTTHPECFEWVWPEERLREIYEHAVPSGDNPWIKTEKGYEKVAK